MCGIIASFNLKDKSPVNEEVLYQLEDQHNRGMRGFGIINIDPKGSYEVLRATEPVKAIVDLRLTPASMIVMHHRMPTSSENKIQQTHPILVDNGSLKHKYLLIHNGCVSNCNELKKEHEDLGFTYTTDTTKEFNDSESFAIEVARFIENQSNCIEVSSYSAFIALQINKKTNKVTEVYFGRNNGSLNLAMSRDKIFISSEGKGHEIDDKFIYHFNLKDFKLKKIKSNYKVFSYSIADKEDDDWKYDEKTGGWKSKNDPKLVPLNSDTPTRTGFQIAEAEDNEQDAIEENLKGIIDSFKEEMEWEMDSLIDKIKDPDEVFLVSAYEEAKEMLTAIKELVENAQLVHQEAMDESASKDDKVNADHEFIIGNK